MRQCEQSGEPDRRREKRSGIHWNRALRLFGGIRFARGSWEPPTNVWRMSSGGSRAGELGHGMTDGNSD